MPLEKFLERTTALVAASSILIIALSASHELGYFAKLGSSFFQSFVSASDYFTNSILWLPVGIITLLAWGRQDWIWKATPRPNRKDRLSWILPTLIVGVPLLLLIFDPYGGNQFLILIMLVYFWVLFFDVLFNPLPAGLLLEDVRKLVKIGVPVCAGLFCLGYQNASSDLKSYTGTYIFTFDNGDKTLSIPLRSFDKGVLIRDPIQDRIELIRWDKIKSIQKGGASYEHNTVGCHLFGLWCTHNGTKP